MRRLPHLTLVFTVMAVLLPAAAFASGASNAKHRHHGPSGCASGVASAVCVYYDGGLRNANGSETSGGNGPGSNSPRVTRLIDRYGGKDKNLLRKLASSDLFGPPLRGGEEGPVNGSSALGAIFDLGAGPTALFALLLAGAAVFGLRKLRIHRAR